jgi:cation/acetate symporter
VIKTAHEVLEGTPAKDAVPAKTSEGFVCELFAVCQNAEPAKTATEAKSGAIEKLAKLNAGMVTMTDPGVLETAKKDAGKLEKDIKKAQDDLKKFEGQTTSLVGLEKPLLRLKNPGILSIPLGFLCVILGSLLYRDKRAEEMWDELYVRQNTGIHAEGATAH